MSLTAGTRLGAYEILAALGAGGMGEVYRARDPRLGRDVAIKLLPAAFTAEPDRLRRFEQEARAAAALNHPNILTVHEIGTHDDRPFLVSEVLEGETLRGALKHGALQVRKAIDYAIQMCRGLSAAHDKGIVHRDLKPENVFVTEDGRIKILDFGLAKLIEAPHATGASTIAAPVAAATAPGVVFGTVGYMSPEQVRGHAVDQRSDIFSFGAILYELLSGRRAFAGDSAADTLSDILVNDPPQLLNRGRNIPSGVDRIVHHCLEKQPARRFQSAADVALALEAITLNDESAAPSTRASSARTTWAKPVGLLATAAAGALLGAGAIWLTDRPPTSPSSDRVLLTDAARLTLGVGFSDWPSWSPDGKLFAFSSNRTGNFEIYIRRVEGGQEVNTTNDPADDVQPAISPDGTSIAFVSTRSSRTPLVRMRATATGDYRTYGEISGSRRC